MSDKTDKVNIDSSDDTVIGLKGSEQHHDLKNRSGEKGDPDHAKTSGDNSSDVAQDVKDAAKEGDDDGAIAAAMKDAVDKS